MLNLVRTRIDGGKLSYIPVLWMEKFGVDALASGGSISEFGFRL